ncbi:MAG: P-loop NTPase [Clostridia bacterium]|nr:P-loop NTPase [Clostridia bacterium]
MGKIWTVCSGSGGVGKTTIALSMAVGAAKAGKKTILLDASGASRSCDLILGLESVLTLDMKDVLRDQIRMDAALYPAAQYANLSIACASLYDQTPVSELSGMILALHSLCDILVIDMPTGQCTLGRGVMRAGDERLLVTRPDNASIRAAERMMLSRAADEASNSLIINRISRDRVKRKTQYPQSTVENLLDMPALACIPEDPSIPECECSARAAIECNGPAWTVLSNLSKALLGGT